ncbi:type IV secretory system conjugative DNA transfer family protein [Arthrobacter sp. NA-172]|uniref:type IV secretory system conjugative DNA transfer family protein n=1 Tax=Arthrobacter sp. NA-172 TaxID=3367524 RepID=UPI003754A8C7
MVMHPRAGNTSPVVTAGLVTLSGLVGFSFLVQSTARILVTWRCGAPSPSPLKPAAAVGLVAARIDWIVRRPPDCDVSTSDVWWVVGPVFVLVAALAVIGIWVWRRWRQSGAWLRQEILNRDGVARRSEILHDFGARAVRRRGKFTRPGLSNPSVEDVSWSLGRSRGVTIHVSTEESMVIQGAPRSGKGLYVVINAILDAPGAVVTTSTRADNLVVTMKARATGDRPVTVFDPQGISGLPSTLRWSPVRGCQDPDIATRRALVITADTEMKGENAAWQKRSLLVLQCLLHAAALSGEGVSAFRRWSSSPVLAREAVEFLSRPGAALGWQADLMGILEDDPRNTSNSWNWCFRGCCTVVVAQGSGCAGSPRRVGGVRP